MNEELPIISLARHGETAWSLTGQHTGLTSSPLTVRGERNARQLGQRLHGLTFATVYTSPLQRAARACALAGFGAVAEVDRHTDCEQIVAAARRGGRPVGPVVAWAK